MLKEYRILICDPNSARRSRYSRILREASLLNGSLYTIVTTGSETEAYHQAMQHTFDLVIISQHMRNHGIPVAQHMVMMFPDVHLLLLYDAQTRAAQSQRIARLGAQVLDKTATAAQLQNAVIDTFGLTAPTEHLEAEPWQQSPTISSQHPPAHAPASGTQIALHQNEGQPVVLLIVLYDVVKSDVIACSVGDKMYQSSRDLLALVLEDIRQPAHQQLDMHAQPVQRLLVREHGEIVTVAELMDDTTLLVMVTWHTTPLIQTRRLMKRASSHILAARKSAADLPPYSTGPGTRSKQPVRPIFAS